MNPVRVLHFTIGGPEYTGIASFLYQYYRHMDRKAVIFDFVFARENSLCMVADDPVFAESDFIELHAVTKKNEISYTRLSAALEGVFKSRQVDIFHINTHRPGIVSVCAQAAVKCHVKTVIAHSHNARFIISGRNLLKPAADLMKAACAVYIRKNCDWLFACSESAGEALFGKKGLRMGSFRVIKNAIDSGTFVYREDVREEVRKKMGIPDGCLVLGHVGRLADQKNQTFSIRLLASLLKKRDQVRLWLVGTGPEEEKLRAEVRARNVGDAVTFLGQRTDVAALLQAMDVFLMPSKWEGLGIAAIEAQAAGLPVYASSAVPPETRVTDLIRYHSTGEDPGKWADRILEECPLRDRKNTRDLICDSGYDISSEAKKLESFYLACGR